MILEQLGYVMDEAGTVFNLENIPRGAGGLAWSGGRSFLVTKLKQKFATISCMIVLSLFTSGSRLC